MKVTDMIISALLKKGIVWEGRNIDITTDIPDSKIKVNIKAEHMTITVRKDDKEEA